MGSSHYFYELQNNIISYDTLKDSYLFIGTQKKMQMTQVLS